MATAYPGAIDTFPATPTPTITKTATTVGGRTHAQRHDDVEAAVLVIEGRLGTSTTVAELVTTGGIRTRQAATQDAVALLGRAGGSSSYVATITPPTLASSITVTLPSATGQLALVAPFIHVRDEKASGTAGGTFTSGSWQTRTLNTEVADTAGIATLASNQITLPAGTYEVDATAPHYGGNARLRVQDITNAVTLAIGGLTESAVGGEEQPCASSRCVGRFTLSGSAAIEVQHRTTTTRATDGLGTAASFGVNEIYAEIILRKVA